MSSDLPRTYKILFSTGDTLCPNQFIQVTRVMGQGFFLIRLLGPDKNPLKELCQKAVFDLDNRFVDDEAGLEVAFHPKGPDGNPFLYGAVTEDGRPNRSIFVAEDDGGKVGAE